MFAADAQARRFTRATLEPVGGVGDALVIANHGPFNAENEESTYVPWCVLRRVTEGQRLRMWARKNAGTNINIQAPARMWGVRVGP